ncbi:hypothetical protein [Arcanobacterium bovis]|uniref:Uncharacterized protein n=1 Tax=Arcanobacterium bovis TaxID=2529275 RepID=A0A4Q9V0Q7_9ACTO|nr:hypothetical protein [Arcanobacterium bovis]TBW22218.1 hypothetical protein EZJ44_05200 [Arcanobacterium bovis]
MRRRRLYASVLAVLTSPILSFLGSVGYAEQAQATAHEQVTTQAHLAIDSDATRLGGAKTHMEQTATSIFADSGDSAYVETWFNQNAQALILASAPDEFSKATAAEVAQYTIGKPIRAAQFEAKGTKVGISESNFWVTPVLSHTNEPVGVVAANFADGKVTKESVYGDADLAVAVASSDSTRAVVYDELLNAWFIVKESVVTAVGAPAKKILLGAIPLETFLVQRDRLIGSGTEIGTSQTASTPTASASKTQSLSALQIVLIVLFVAAVVTVSLIWLRWEQSEHANRKSDEEQRIHRPETGKWSIVDHTKKPRKTRFRDSGGKISLYRKADIEKSGTSSAGTPADSTMKTIEEDEHDNEVLDN